MPNSGFFWSMDVNGELMPVEYGYERQACVVVHPGTPIRNRPDGVIPLYRFYDDDGTHFWTTDKKGELLPKRFRREQITCYVFRRQMDGTVPMYRFYDGDGGHYWTLLKRGEGLSGYHRESAVFYVYPPDTEPTKILRPLYRFRKGLGKAWCARFNDGLFPDTEILTKSYFAHTRGEAKALAMQMVSMLRMTTQNQRVYLANVSEGAC